MVNFGFRALQDAGLMAESKGQPWSAVRRRNQVHTDAKTILNMTTAAYLSQACPAMGTAA